MAHKFSGDYSRLDSPKRQEIFPVDTIINAVEEMPEGIAIADLGCGTGYLSLPLAKRIAGNGTVYAVDINSDMLSILKERAEGLENIELVKSEENSIPIPNSTIDISFMLAVFHELEDPVKFLMEIRRISKPVHSIVVVEWNDVQGEMGPPLHERIPAKDIINFFKDRSYALKKRFAPSRYTDGFVFTVPTCRPLDRVWV